MPASRRRSPRPAVVRDPFSPCRRSDQRGASGRQHAGDPGGDDRRERSECDDGPPDVHGIGARHRLPRNRLEQRDDAGRESRAERRARERQHQAFGERLPEQPPPSRAERRAHRVLGMPLQPAGQQQAGDVGAGDQKHDGHRSEQRHEQPAAGAIQHVLHRRDSRADALQRRIGLRRPCRERGELGPRRLDRRIAAKPRDRVPGAACRPRLVRRDAEPEVDERVEIVVGLARCARVGKEADPGRHHADDRQRRRHPAHADGASNDGGIAVEFALPEVVAEDDGGRRSIGTPQLAVHELAAEHRPQSEHAEVAGRHHHPAHRRAAVR